MFIGTPAPGSRAVPGTPLAEVQARAASLRAALQASAPQPPTVNPGLEGREKELAEAAAREYEPSNKDIMNAITVMQQNMVVRDDIKADVMEALQPVHARLDSVDASANQALNETKELNERLTKQEQSSVIEFDRVGKLETEIEGLKAQLASQGVGFKREKIDPAYVRVTFKNFPEGTSKGGKKEAIDVFLKKYFQEDQAVFIDHFNGKASFAQFATPAAAKRVIDGCKTKKLENFKDVKITPALTQIDISRNVTLYQAEDLVKKDGRATGKKVELKRAKDRGVYVDDKAAFLQEARYDPKGCFVSEFKDLKLP